MHSKQNGFISIPLVITLSALILSFGLLASFTSESDIASSFSSGNASKALFYAKAGMRDILERVSINRDYNGTNNLIDLTYDIDFSGDSTPTTCDTPSDGCASVRLSKQPDYGSSTVVRSPRIITVTGRYKDAVRKIQYDAVFSSYTELISVKHAEVKVLPTASTGGATSITSSAATLNGWSNPNSNSVYTWFRYDDTPVPTTCDDSFGTRAPSGTAVITPSPTNTGTDPVHFATSIASLASNKTYYYCAIVDTESSGSSPKVYGDIYSFRTLP